MKKISIPVLFLLLGACSSLDVNNHADYNNQTPVSAFIHTDKPIAAGGPEPVQVHVLQNGEPYEIQENIAITLSSSEKGTIETTAIEPQEDGTPETSVEFPEDGLYRLRADIPVNEHSLQVTKRIGVGNLSEREQQILNADQHSTSAGGHH
ncbi:hypothetical protein [Salibacterium halotolerans]|uniref:YtkA-like n=1 Tax=Salibacterium halotolerans TaxID=1884432 RepID=A0A1I5W154_9BACI|nr:hypothetical protein [Salibacterium halotolerans]SFQ12986.1 hypothetical protein SAMN05518683_11815 [Salibacterium halotolerans]